MREKRFVQIPLLGIVIALFIIASAGAGVVLHRQGKLSFFIKDAFQFLKGVVENSFIDRNSQQESKKEIAIIRPGIEVHNLTFKKGFLEGFLGRSEPIDKGGDTYIFTGELKNISNVPCYFVTSKISLYDGDNNLVYSKENPFKVLAINKDKYSRLEGVGRDVILPIPPHESMPFFFWIRKNALWEEEEESLPKKGDIISPKLSPPSGTYKTFTEAKLEVVAEPYFENSPFIKQHYLEVLKTNRTISKIPESWGVRSHIQNLEKFSGKLKNASDKKLDRVVVFALIYNCDEWKDNYHFFYAPLGIYREVFGTFNPSEEIDFEFQEETSGYYGHNCKSYKVYAWGWETQ